MEIPKFDAEAVLLHLQNGHRFYETTKAGRFLLPVHIQDPNHYLVSKGICEWLSTEHSINHLNDQTRIGGVHNPVLEPGLQTQQIIHGYIYSASDVSRIAEIFNVHPEQITHGLDEVAEL